MLIHDRFYNEGDYNYDKFSSIVKYLSKRQCVEFAFYCAKDVFHLVEEEHKERAKCCIDLVEKWLIDESLVTSEDISNAADAAAYAAAADSWAAAAAVDAVRAAADSWAAANAAFAADCAIRACTNINNKYNEYLIIANSYLTKTNINCPNYEIEGKILYLIDELEENIIVHKDKYYVNMNGIENCPKYGLDSQEELLKELFNSECLFWEFVRNWLDNLYKNQQA